jgi:2-polyprenyl-3-methyl-5-hydroxy-6-metoxy-1,4-benzoquinol methylase
VLGIESDKVSAEIAKGSCDEVLCEDVEKIEELKYPKEYFDVIVFADVLEHLRQPDKVLLNLRKYLRADGFMVASLPNIARIDIRLKLILGRFDYGDSGILDKTHLKFFTLSSAKKLFTENGFMIERIDYSGRAARFRIMPTCFAFQFIILAKKNKE